MWIGISLSIICLGLATSAVRRASWADENINGMLDHRVPVVLEGAPVSHWRAMTQWSPEKLERRTGATVGVKISRQRTFPIGCCPLIPMNMGELWRRIREATASGEFVYLNANLPLLGDVADDVGEVTFLSGRRPELVNVWMGTAGTTAGLHYDPFENFFVQVTGRKKFLLFPPSVHESLYLYPKTHPKHRQAQVNATHPDLSRFPRAAFITDAAFEVVVGPGDVLYLPPLWFHQVEALDNSASVNSWYSSAILDRMDHAWSVALPLSPGWPASKVASVVAETLRQVVDNVCGPNQSQRFVSYLLEARYEPLYRGSFDGVDLLKDVASTNDPHLRVYLREQDQLAESVFIKLRPGEPIPCGRADAQEAERIRQAAQELARHFRPFGSTLDCSPRAPTEHAVVSMTLADFLEDAAAQAVGDSRVPAFLRDCVVASLQDATAFNCDT